jgi:hypothetical protein
MALAKKRGMESEDDSPLDYCEADDAAKVLQAPTFAEAVELAKSKIGEDYFGQVRIEHLVKVESRYMRDRWDADAVWHYSGPEHPLDVSAPEYRPDIDLIDDERIVTERLK